MKLDARGREVAGTLYDLRADDVWDADEEMAADEYEEYEEKIVDQATASRTIRELEDEIRILKGLEEQARGVVRSGKDRKWEELSRLLQDTPDMHEAGGRQRKRSSSPSIRILSGTGDADSWVAWL